MSSAHRLRRSSSGISRVPPRARACRGSAGTPVGGGAAGAAQPFLQGLAFCFELEKGSNWLPQALIGQELLAILIFVSRYFKSGASAAASGELLGCILCLRLCDAEACITQKCMAIMADDGPLFRLRHRDL
jgi:hypothetical protein